MPELPEVETIARGLRPVLTGRRIQEAQVLRADLLRVSPRVFRSTLRDAEIEAVGRRGKNLVLFLSDSARLVVNLGMTGRLLFLPGPPREADSPHLGVKLSLSPDGALLYDDVRRFGHLLLLSKEAWEEESARLGPEPLEPGLTPETFHALLSSSRSPVRSWLLDQTHLAGVGNIYANEALFRARIHPFRPSHTLCPEESRALLRGLRRVLTDAIRARGTTLRDYRTVSGDVGGYAAELLVYGRDGSDCPRCNAPVKRVVFGNRSAFFCPRCQPEDR